MIPNNDSIILQTVQKAKSKFVEVGKGFVTIVNCWADGLENAGLIRLMDGRDAKSQPMMKGCLYEEVFLVDEFDAGAGGAANPAARSG